MCVFASKIDGQNHPLLAPPCKPIGMGLAVVPKQNVGSAGSDVVEFSQ